MRVEHAVEQVGIDVGPRPAVGERDGGGREPMPAGVAAAPHARPVPRVASSACSSVPHRPQHGSRRPCPHTSTSGGASPTTVGQSRSGRSGVASSAVSRSGMASTGTRWSTPSRWCVLVRRWCTTRRSPSAEASSCGTTVMSRARGSAAAVASGSISLTSDGPRQRPLHQQQLIERTGGADRVDPLRLRPRRAAEGRIPRGRVGFGGVDGAHQVHATDRRPSAGWGGPIDGGIGSIPAGQPAHNRTRVGEAGRSPALTRSRRSPTLVPVASRNACLGRIGSIGRRGLRIGSSGATRQGP